MTTFYLLCGKIAAGKSTLAERLALERSAILISEDRFTATLFGDQLKTIDDYDRISARLRAAIGPHVIALLRHGVLVVLDFPANTRAFRLWMRSLIEATGVGHELHWLDISDETCLTRLGKRNAAATRAFTVLDANFALFTRYFVPPAPDEGFAVVVHCDKG